LDDDRVAAARLGGISLSRVTESSGKAASGGGLNKVFNSGDRADCIWCRGHVRFVVVPALLTDLGLVRHRSQR